MAQHTSAIIQPSNAVCSSDDATPASTRPPTSTEKCDERTESDESAKHAKQTRQLRRLEGERERGARTPSVVVRGVSSSSRRRRASRALPGETRTSFFVIRVSSDGRESECRRHEATQSVPSRLIG